MPEPRRNPMVRVLRNLGGILLVLLGVVGLFLPILQGILFLALGLALIDVPQKQMAHRWLLRWRWYRWLADRQERVLAAFRERRRRAREGKRRSGA
jgi:uncharacterized membrane protein YbaN (DUF454 family)